VLALIAGRRIGRLRVTIWQAMTGGAVAVLSTGQIPLAEALRAIDVDILLFLFGMFVLAEGLLRSGALFATAYRLLAWTRTTDALVLGTLFATGFASALLMNDTLAVIGTPLVLRLALEHRVAPRLMLMALAFAITIGSVMSPIGNPQNLFIAVRAPIEAPFVTFSFYFAIPTVLNLLLAYALLRFAFRRDFHRTPLVHARVVIKDTSLARLAWVGIGTASLMIVLKVSLVSMGTGMEPPLSAIALAGALPLLVFSRRRAELIRGIDWTTLVFFTAMFVLVAAVWRSGSIQFGLSALGLDLSNIPTVMGASLLMSQLVSNVPLVGLYLPLLQEAGTDTAVMMALASGSTLAGNLLIFGAASNVIIIQRAEREGHTLSFWGFAAVGAPLAVLNTLVCALFIVALG